MKIKEIIVVEGKSDTIAIKRAVDADTIETNGSAIGEEVMKQIELAIQRRGVIIFTDPDYPGQRIRKLITERFPSCKHAFLPKHKATSKDGSDLGIENARPEDIRSALSEVREVALEQVEEQITMEDLMDAGLVAGPLAKKRREKLSLLLNIGHVNGKQLHKRLWKFRITKEEFTKAYFTVLKEEDDA